MPPCRARQNLFCSFKALAGDSLYPIPRFDTTFPALKLIHAREKFRMLQATCTTLLVADGACKRASETCRGVLSPGVQS